MAQSYVHRMRWLITACAWIVALLITGSYFTTSAVQAGAKSQTEPAAPQSQPVAIYFFWGDGCPHCAEAEPFLEDLVRRYPNAELRPYEVWYVPQNQQLMVRMAAAYGFEPSGVPTIFVGERYWIGYAESIAEQIEAAVAECSATGCRDAGLGIIPGIPTPVPTSAPTAVAMTSVDPTAAGETAALAGVAPETADYIEVPLIGRIDLVGQSLAASTALIAFVDGFNPCSLWVLSMLLALTLHTGSRKKVFWIGFVFITVTALIYMLFIAGLFTMFSVVGYMKWIQSVVAVVALFFAVINIKDYFWYKEGLSFTIADEKKPGIYRQMRKVMEAGNSMWGMIGATVVLAAGVSLVEFSCTAGFPILWTNLLIAQQATTMTFVLLLLLYMLIYQLDELGIFAVAVFTLKASKLEEKQGRILKLVGGMLMLTLAVVMLYNPALMNSISASLWVFAGAFGAAGLVLLLHRVLLPQFGVYLGSESLLHPKQQHHEIRSPHQALHARKRDNSRR